MLETFYGNAAEIERHFIFKWWVYMYFNLRDDKVLGKHFHLEDLLMFSEIN